MAFDNAWKTHGEMKNSKELDQEKRIDLIMNELQWHPFLQKDPNQARQVAKFRIRLLKLS